MRTQELGIMHTCGCFRLSDHSAQLPAPVTSLLFMALEPSCLAVYAELFMAVRH